jgi:hypothetical protein
VCVVPGSVSAFRTTNTAESNMAGYRKSPYCSLSQHFRGHPPQSGLTESGSILTRTDQSPDFLSAGARFAQRATLAAIGEFSRVPDGYIAGRSRAMMPSRSRSNMPGRKTCPPGTSCDSCGMPASLRRSRNSRWPASTWVSFTLSNQLRGSGLVPAHIDVVGIGDPAGGGDQPR